MRDWPHEYTMSWAPEAVDEFVAFRRHIQSHGTVEPWPPAPVAAIYHNKYSVIGDTSSG